MPESVISMAMVFVMTIDDDCNSSVHDDNGSNIDDDHSNSYQMIMSMMGMISWMVSIMVA